ncbi:hypothetical protein HMPREF0044_1188 [Gleimia coleocanis DSM 15436]|uniref:ROK family protein n=1 Tax=Gleimia coleocanis DSM 15436 TaxID=525245 RepID=C0W198_9ACTO|nr:ROK family transcriptional regulator [Gleimia coleocanis]EEH63587.1 hypothetical protein HMPREF0044_1188 [Gleimia coleocanis DSM 15436]
MSPKLNENTTEITGSNPASNDYGIREQNTLKVINALAEDESWLSLADLQESTKLSRPTLNLVLNALVEKEIALSKTSTSGHALGGRKPQVFKINASHHNSVVMRANLSGCSGQVLSAAGNTIYTDYIPHTDYASVHETFNILLEKLLPHTNGPVISSVIATMGIVSNGKLIRCDAFPSLNTTPWIETLKNTFHQAGHHPHMQLVNDAKIATEWMAHLLKQNDIYPQSLVAIHCSDTVGAGLMFNGKLLEGANGAAGEILLGKENDWHEAHKLIRRLADKYQRPANEVLSCPELTAKEKDQIEAISRCIGNALVPLINLLDPDVIAISGALSDCNQTLEPIVSEIIYSQTATHTQLYVTERGALSVLNGCALHAKEMSLEQML